MNSRGRIGLLCQHFYPELISTGMHMTELATRLHDLGWDVTVVCAQPTLSMEQGNERVPRRGRVGGVLIRRVGAVGSHRNLVARAVFASTYLLSSFVKAVRLRKSVDGLVITTNPPILGLAGWLAKRLFGMKYVVISYDVYPDLAGRLGVIKPGGLVFRLWDRATRAMLRGADRVIVIGRDMGALVATKVPEAVLELIPNWSDESHVEPVAGPDNPFRAEHGGPGQFIVQYSGRMARTHNVEPILEAAALLRGKPVLFQFIGDGAKKEKLRRRATELALDNVVFLPYQPREDLASVLSAADLSVVCLDGAFSGLSVPSKAYGIMAAGTAVLALVDTDSEIAMTVDEHDCGVVLPDPTPEEVAAVVEGLMADRNHLDRLGRNAREAFLAHYTLDVAARRYDTVLADAFLPNDGAA